MTLLEDCRTILKENKQNTENLEAWVVGGAVRDDKLGRDYNDIDFTVVNETEQSMEERGFNKIDAQNFPVYQDSEGHEYALARQEESTGEGYHDFETVTDNVDIVDDLERRDFTINAIAQRISDGVYEYPVAVEGNHAAHSIRDLNQGILRHITNAFEEDPIRILRMARFASRYPSFEIAEETMVLAQKNSSKLDLEDEDCEIPGERVGEEIIKAMNQAEDPVRFFEVLQESGAMQYVMPKVEKFKEVSAGPEKHHQEGDMWTHTMMTIREAHDIRPNNHRLLLMALVHDIGKVKNKESDNHGQHPKEGIPLIREMGERLKFSNELEQTMVDASRHHMRIHSTPMKAHNRMGEKKVLDLVEKLEAEKGASLDELIDLCQADSKGRIPSQPIYEKGIRKRINTAKEAINKIDADYVTSKRGKTIEDYSGESIGQMVIQDRVEYMKRNQEPVEETRLDKVKEKAKNLF